MKTQHFLRVEIPLKELLSLLGLDNAEFTFDEIKACDIIADPKGHHLYVELKSNIYAEMEASAVTELIELDATLCPVPNCPGDHG